MEKLNEMYAFCDALTKYRDQVGDSSPDRKTVQSLRTELQRTYVGLQETITKYSNEDPTDINLWGQEFNVFEDAFEPPGLYDESEKLGELDTCIRITNKAIGKLESEGKTWPVQNQTLGISKNAPKSPTHTSRSAQPNTKQVFVVHGQDEAAKQTVARFLEHLDLDPIILHERENRGRTIIEKLEGCSADVGFAVVLLTPDDVGAAMVDKNRLKPRARQNVVFELGFFLGRLGRKRVCVLHKGGVEIFSDYSGVLFVPMDENDGWKLKLAKEFKAAGVSIDLDKAIE